MAVPSFTGGAVEWHRNGGPLEMPKIPVGWRRTVRLWVRQLCFRSLVLHRLDVFNLGHNVAPQELQVELSPLHDGGQLSKNDFELPRVGAAVIRVHQRL